MQDLNQFAVRGFFKFNNQDGGDTKSVFNNQTTSKNFDVLSGVRSVKSQNVRPTTSSRVTAVINPQGSRILGIDVHDFINYYTAAPS